MKERITTQPQNGPVPSFPPTRSGLLQRKCACGNSPGLTGECAECSDRMTVQRHTTGQAGPSTAPPPIVHEVLRSSGEPLDAHMREFMERRFGHDFSRVRVHTGAQAAESARAMHALAYTVGADVVFGAGQYRPGSRLGQQLIGHELTHVIQQESAPPTNISAPSSQFSAPGIQTSLSISKAEDPQEREADRMAESILRTTVSTPAWRQGSLSEIEIQPIPVVQHYGGPKLHRLALPLESKAPASAMSIRRFIELVEIEEGKYPPSEQTNTPLMITRIRKIFYGKSTWDKHLITGAASIPAPYRIEETETGRVTADLPGPFNLDLVRKKTEPKDKTGKVPEIFGGQELLLEDGSFLDIGHVFAGLDALNRPNLVDGPFYVNITNNVDAVTWVGDLGSVLAEVQFKAVAKGSISEAEKQAIIDEFAPPQDMLGNIDAYVIGSNFAVKRTLAVIKVSEMLREFYLGATAQSAREHRYSSYARSVGLVGWDSKTFSNETEWIDNYTDEVNDSAALYLGANTEGIAQYPAGLGMAMNQGARKLVILYLTALKTKIAAEPPVK